MYSAVDDRAGELARRFCDKAEYLWAIERDKGIDSTTSLAATEFLSMGYLGHGRDHAVLKYLTEAANMGARMGFFKLPGLAKTNYTRDYTGDEQASRRYAAWGAFNWITSVLGRVAKLKQLTNSSTKSNVPLLPPTWQHLPFTSQCASSLQSLRR